MNQKYFTQVLVRVGWMEHVLHKLIYGSSLIFFYCLDQAPKIVNINSRNGGLIFQTKICALSRASSDHKSNMDYLLIWPLFICNVAFVEGYLKTNKMRFLMKVKDCTIPTNDFTSYYKTYCFLLHSQYHSDFT